MWSGEIQMRAKMGVPVRLGRFAVPKAVTMTLLGTEGNPNLRIEYVMREGRPECREVHVTSTPTGRGLRTADLDWLALDNFARSAFEGFAQTVVRWDAEEKHTTTPVAPTDIPALRRDIDDSLAARPTATQQLVDVARVYADNLAGGAPLKAVEMHLGLHRRTAARRVQAARERGFLTSANEFVEPASDAELTPEQAARQARENVAILELMRKSRGAVTPEIRERIRRNTGLQEETDDGKHH